MAFGWGIVGLGSIARKFAEGLKSADGSELVAVGSRTQAKADRFGDEFGAKHRHGSYEALAANPAVDAIYVASPHAMHMEDTMLCISHGKAVLCEKPFTINAPEAEVVIHEARGSKVFVMEAMWTRFTPAIVKVRELVQSGAIGEIQSVSADFGFRAEFDPKGRLFNPDLGGGALLDVGVYCISLASMLLGEPNKVTGVATLGKTRVDENDSISLKYRSGAVASLFTSIRANTPHGAAIVGSSGTIIIQPPFWIPKQLTLRVNGKADETIELPYTGNGYNYEADEVRACVQAGLLESAVMPSEETWTIMKTMDTLRAAWGVKYPMER